MHSWRVLQPGFCVQGNAPGSGDAVWQSRGDGFPSVTGDGSHVATLGKVQTCGVSSALKVRAIPAGLPAGRPRTGLWQPSVHSDVAF